MVRSVIGGEDGEHQRGGHRGGERGAGGQAAEEGAARWLRELLRPDDFRRCSRWRHRQQRLDTAAQKRRRPLFQVGLRHRFMHGAERLELFGAAGATRDMRFDVARVPGVELAVDQRVKQDFAFGAVHDAAPETGRSAPFQADRSIDRARASRDITVPTGTPATSAIS